MKVKFLLTCILFQLNAALAQVIPAKVLNDTRTFEVTACNPSKNIVISVWMEKRPERKDNSLDAADMRIGYKMSTNSGDDWSEKRVIDAPNTFGNGNPVLASNEKGQTYMACMHIGKDFYSGNLSLYEFDFVSKQFNLKSVPVKSDSCLLDKPSIVSVGKEIHLVYVVYGKRRKNFVQYQMSGDQGKTWTDPVKVFDDKGSHLGPSIAISKAGQVIISCGAYGKRNVTVIKKINNADSTLFSAPIIVGPVPVTMGAAMTELYNDNDRLILTWQNPHQPRETWLSFSQDAGNTWSAPSQITAMGNLLSSVFEKSGNPVCIFSDFSNQQFSVGYKVLSQNYNVLKEGKLMESVALANTDEYIGAFQKLFIRNQQLFAFWIDYPNNSMLKLSKWKM